MMDGWGEDPGEELELDMDGRSMELDGWMRSNSSPEDTREAGFEIFD